MPPLNTILGFAVHFTLLSLSLAMLAVVYRFLKGPTLPDRMIVMDLLSSVVISLAIVFGILTGLDHYLSIAVSVALIAFMGSVAFAYYLTKMLNND
jgi:multicomponent Na+:H+ antiporter subunit F